MKLIRTIPIIILFFISFLFVREMIFVMFAILF